MDFFERQEKARHKTKLLVAYFICAVAVLLYSVCALTYWKWTGLL